VSVRDANFRVVKVLAPAELAAFQEHWQNKQEVKTTFFKLGPQHYKLYIERRDADDQWLYMADGYVQVLSKQAMPAYKLQNPEVFNRLIGAAK
jgi:hypothetical protein